MLARVIPFTRLARKAQLQIVVRLERHEEAHARAATGFAMQVRDCIVRAQAHVPTQIQRPRAASAIRRARPIYPPDGIVDQLAGLAQRNSPSQLCPHSCAGKQIARQWIIRNLVQPARAPLGIGAKGQQHVSRHQGYMIIHKVIQLSEAKVDGCGRTTGPRRNDCFICGAGICDDGLRAVLQTEIETGLEQDVLSAAIQKNGRKIREQKRPILPRSLGELELRVAENGEVMIDGGLIERHPGKRFHWDSQSSRLLLHVCDRLLCCCTSATVCCVSPSFFSKSWIFCWSVSWSF